MSRAFGAPNMYWVRFAEALLLPPWCFPLLAGLGLLLLLRRRSAPAAALVAISLLSFYLTATPWMAGLLLAPLDRYPEIAATETSAVADAVVVLGAGRARGSTDPADPLSGSSVERLEYGAELSRRLGVPLLVSGQQIRGGAVALLAGRFDLVPRWVEGDSRNTYENATLSARLLGAAGVQRVYLVTHYYHQPRAVAAFQSAGLAVVPAPMGFAPPGSSARGFAALAPRISSLRLSAAALHEIGGRFWYRLRYGV